MVRTWGMEVEMLFRYEVSAVWDLQMRGNAWFAVGLSLVRVRLRWRYEYSEDLWCEGACRKGLFQLDFRTLTTLVFLSGLFDTHLNIKSEENTLWLFSRCKKWLWGRQRFECTILMKYTRNIEIEYCNVSSSRDDVRLHLANLLSTWIILSTSDIYICLYTSHNLIIKSKTARLWHHPAHTISLGMISLQALLPSCNSSALHTQLRVAPLAAPSRPASSSAWASCIFSTIVTFIDARKKLA